MLAAARLAKLRFSVNVILDSKKKVIDCFAGDPGEEHYAGCAAQAEAITVNAVPADIVVGSNGGAPLIPTSISPQRASTLWAQPQSPAQLLFSAHL